MRGQIVEFERLDVGERPSLCQAGSARHGGVRSEVEKDLVGRECARSPAIHAHFERLWRHKAPLPHDQFGAARFVVFQVLGDLTFNHLALAAAHHRHIDHDRTGHRAELRRVTRQMRHLGTANFILARHAGDVRTRAADPPPFYDGSALTRSRHMPSDQLAAGAAARGLGHQSVPLAACIFLHLRVCCIRQRTKVGERHWNARRQLRRGLRSVRYAAAPCEMVAEVAEKPDDFIGNLRGG